MNKYNTAEIKRFFDHVGSIVKKELKSYIDTPTVYIVAVVFLLLVEFLFFKQAFLVKEASLRSISALLPWLFLLLIPAMSMGAISEEEDKGTLEMILTKPVRELEFIVGKFFAGFVFVSVVMLFLFPVASSLSKFGNLDWGMVFGQYIASVTLGFVLISLGIMVSSLFRSQISSFLVGAVLSLFLLIIGFDFVTGSIPHTLVIIFERLSALTHYNSMSRGVIDLRDIWYTVSFVAIAMAITYLRLMKRKYSNQAGVYRSYKLGVVLFVVIAILTNIAGSRIPGRVDLTSEKLFTLTPVTRDILANLDDIVTINMYVTRNLPAQFQPTLRDTTDILRDYERYSHGNIRINIKDPTANPNIVAELRAAGVKDVQFNVVNNEEFQVKQGYFGLSVNYAGKSESIPFIEGAGDLEYRLTGFIRQLTNQNKKRIVFINGHGEKTLGTEYGLLRTELSKQFTVTEMTLNSSTPKIDPDTAVLVFAGPTTDLDTASQDSIRQAVKNGISTLYLLDAININIQIGQVTPNRSNIFSFINSEYGVSVDQNLVYDLRSNETVNVGGGGFFQILLPYPLWVKALASKSPHPVTTKIDTLVLPWVSSLSVDKSVTEQKGWDATPLFSTSNFAGAQSGEVFNLDPQQQFPQAELSTKNLVFAFSSKDENAGNAIVISDSDFLKDEFVQQNIQNIGFGLSSVSWLSKESSLSSIKLKQSTDRALLFAKPSQMTMVKYGNLLFVLFAPLLLGFWRFTRRKALSSQSYK